MSGLRDLRKPGDPGEPQEADGLGGAYASRTADDGAGGPGDAGGSGRTGGPGGTGGPGAGSGQRVSPRATAGPRGAADPVKALLHRHRELCERAVDPLEIAAGLEAHGITDRTAARFRHRDVFSLAEELFARVPRDGDTARPDTTAPLKARADWIVLTLLPGALCLASVLALRHTHGQTRLLTAAVGIIALASAVRAALRRGPLSRADRTPAPGMTGWTWWLVGYALLGDGLLQVAITGGPDGPPAPDGDWPLAAAPVLALALACAPAAWTTHLFTRGARRKLTASRGLEDFAASVRPLLLATVTLFLCALAGLLALCATALDEPLAVSGALATGALLHLARLLTVHGFTHGPRMLLACAATAQALALTTVFAARLPGLTPLSTPVETLVTAWHPAAVPTLSCGVAALVLLVHATRRLTRASAHSHPERAR
ncbi:hypothetical protein ABZ606_21360 [Streptomyces sp. NPDC012461]|uniref:hypothetical protein n=1 Tax=Streptomyces sp. NPDC012461 TaxID=3155117 RepID=UPI0019617742|nr:hypothetical protein [Streptomyces sp. S12]